jgi:hypothetical protein
VPGQQREAPGGRTKACTHPEGRVAQRKDSDLDSGVLRGSREVSGRWTKEHKHSGRDSDQGLVPGKGQDPARRTEGHSHSRQEVGQGPHSALAVR